MDTAPLSEQSSGHDPGRSEVLDREDRSAMNTSPRVTDLTLRMRCPNCASTLSFLAGRSQLTFHCREGHAFPMQQLFQSQSQDIHRGLQAVQGVWEEKCVVLREVAERARTEGRTELAATFQREVDLLRVRIERLREQLRSLGDSGNSSSAAG
jgi:hypothetical protein